MKNIGIVEFQRNHYDFVLTIYLLIDNLFPHDNIKLFITKELFESLKIEMEGRGLNLNDEIITLIDSRNVEKGLSIVEKHELDITICNTIPLGRQIIFYVNYFKKNRGRKYFGIHNINTWFSFGEKNIKNLARFYLKKELLRRSSGLFVLNQQLKNNIQSRTSIPVVSIPFKTPINDLSSSTDIYNELNFVIPGMVEEGRRDYRVLLKTFKKLTKIHPNIKFIFLGKMKSMQVLNLINDLTIEKNIVYFDDFVDQQSFNKWMSTAAFIIAPVVREYKNLGYTEQYGKTKASGAEFDAIKYKIPLIIKSHYKVDSILRSSTITYSDENELEGIISNLINDKRLLEQYRNKAISNSNFYRIDQFLERYPEIKDFFAYKK